MPWSKPREKPVELETEASLTLRVSVAKRRLVASQDRADRITAKFVAKGIQDIADAMLKDET